MTSCWQISIFTRFLCWCSISATHALGQRGATSEHAFCDPAPSRVSFSECQKGIHWPHLLPSCEPLCGFQNARVWTEKLQDTSPTRERFYCGRKKCYQSHFTDTWNSWSLRASFILLSTKSSSMKQQRLTELKIRRWPCERVFGLDAWWNSITEQVCGSPCGLLSVDNTQRLCCIHSQIIQRWTNSSNGQVSVSVALSTPSFFQYVSLFFSSQAYLLQKTWKEKSLVGKVIKWQWRALMEKTLG